MLLSKLIENIVLIWIFSASLYVTSLYIYDHWFFETAICRQIVYQLSGIMKWVNQLLYRQYTAMPDLLVSTITTRICCFHLFLYDDWNCDEIKVIVNRIEVIWRMSVLLKGECRSSKSWNKPMRKMWTSIFYWMVYGSNGEWSGSLLLMYRILWMNNAMNKNCLGLCLYLTFKTFQKHSFSKITLELIFDVYNRLILWFWLTHVRKLTNFLRWSESQKQAEDEHDEESHWGHHIYDWCIILYLVFL